MQNVDAIGLWLLAGFAVCGGLAWAAQWWEVRQMRRQIAQRIKSWGRGM